MVRYSLSGDPGKISVRNIEFTNVALVAQMNAGDLFFDEPKDVFYFQALIEAGSRQLVVIDFG